MTVLRCLRSSKVLLPDADKLSDVWWALDDAVAFRIVCRVGGACWRLRLAPLPHALLQRQQHCAGASAGSGRRTVAAASAERHRELLSCCAAWHCQVRGRACHRELLRAPRTRRSPHSSR